MARVLILVEGQTEERFVTDVLAPHLESRQVWATPIILATKLPAGGGSFRGGVKSWNQIQRDVTKLLHGAGDAHVSTMLDYYALPGDVPGMGSRTGTPRERVQHVQDAMAERIGDTRFRPFLVLHELEALVFSDLAACAWVFDQDAAALPCLQRVAAAFPNPEDINEGAETAPSKRILGCFPGYQKTLHGPMAIGAIGLATIGARCVHFASWLAWLESLGATV